MTPEEKQTVKAYLDADAAILYQNTDVEKLQSLEDIEQVVRQHMLENVSLQIGLFLSNQRQKPLQSNPEDIEVVSES